MNFVPKGPIESALAETLDGVGEPAWIIDAGRGAVLGANGRGGAVWGIPAMSPVLDSVVPALRGLRSRLAQGSFLEATTTTVEPLKFWTAGGIRTLACEVRTLDDSVGPGLLLVIAGAVAKPSTLRREVRRREMPLTVTAERAKAPLATRRELPEAFRQAAPPTPSPPPLNDMETLREIARRIRQGSARITAGVDAPANEDVAPPPPQQPAAPRVEAPRTEAPRRSGDQSIDEQHAHLAHEIRTPLAAIVSLAEVITEERLGPWPNERYRGYVRDILASARHGLEVVDGILRDVPSESGAARVLTEIDLNAEVAAIGTSLQPLAEKSGARIEAALGGSLPRVTADRRNVRQMLINLVSNSIKHGGPAVRIKITTGYELNGDVWAEVEDNGPGLPPAEKPGAGAGAPRKAGLGLPLTRSLAAANGARLDLKSRPGRGVRARIVFASSAR